MITIHTSQTERTCARRQHGS